jgi:hypothetical protein
MAKKFRLGSGESRSIHKTIPGTNTKAKVETKSVKFEGKCGSCKTRNAVVIKVMFNPPLKADVYVNNACGRCGKSMTCNGKL